MTPWGVQKGLRIQEIALQHKLPVVSLIESGGANLMYQAELFIPGGRTFATQARLSAAGIPQVTVVNGSSTAGGAYLQGLSGIARASCRERVCHKVSLLGGAGLLKQ